MGKKRTIEELKNLWMTIEMPDESIWAVPVMKIVQNRLNFCASEHAKNFPGEKNPLADIREKILQEEVLPLFTEDDYEIKDWASGNMDWDDIKEYAIEIPNSKTPTDFQRGWVNGQKELVTEWSLPITDLNQHKFTQR